MLLAKMKIEKRTNKIIIRMKKGYVAYSAILIKFITPLLNGEEDEEEYLTKARMGWLLGIFMYQTKTDYLITM